MVQQIERLESWTSAIEERRGINLSAAWNRLANPRGLQVEWIQMRPCVFPTELQRNLSIVAALGSGFLIETEAAPDIFTDHGEIALLSPHFKRRASFAQNGEVLRLAFDDVLVRHVASECGVETTLEDLTYRKLTDPLVYEIVHLLADEVRPGGRCGPSYAAALALSLLGFVLRGCPPAGRDGASEAGLSTARLNRCRQYIENNLGNDLSVAEIARAVELSPYYFARAFKRATGRTPHAYVLERRIAAARSLVRNTTRPLNEIAGELGFSNPAHFSSVFSRMTGVAPSVFRARGGAS